MRNLLDNVALGKAIEQKGWTIEKVADELNCSQSTIYRILKGESKPHLTRLRKIVEIFGKTVLYQAITEPEFLTGQFNQSEQQFRNWFSSLSYPHQCRIAGYCNGVIAGSRFVDVDLAATLSEQLAVKMEELNQQSKGQSG